MGAERWLMFEKGETAKVKKFLKGRKCILLEEFDVAVFFNWVGPRFEASFSFGWGRDEFAMLVCREISKRFRVQKIGADSVGWYPDKEWIPTGEHSPRACYGSYSSWPEWLRSYDALKFGHIPASLIGPKEREFFTRLDEAATKIFAEMS